MKIVTLKSNQSPDGQLGLVSSDLKRILPVPQLAKNFREALENWSAVKAELSTLATQLNQGDMPGSMVYDESKLKSVLPRTWLFADGSAFIHHIKLVRMARKAPLPETLMTVPLMYQGECGRFLDFNEDIPQRDFSYGTDFEGEVAVITDFVPMGTSATEALKKVLA